MKKLYYRSIAAGLLILAAVIVHGCFKITSVSQPSTIAINKQFTAQLVVKAEGTSDANPHYGIVGILVPTTWRIDSVWYTGGYTNYCKYLHPDSADNEPGGQCNYWADTLEVRYPAGPNMHWVTYQSATAAAVRTDTVDVILNIKMTTGAALGTFNLGYFTSHAALDFTDPDYYAVTLNRAITVTATTPVELNSLSAKSAGNSIVLNWNTATETNNKGFEIERSSDRINFSKIGFVSGQGTSTSKVSYSFTDNEASVGMFYYRLRQVDLDGSAKYSDVVCAEITQPAGFALISNYPNPFNPSTTFKLNLPAESEIKIQIYNSIGELVKTAAAGRLSAGVYNIRFDASNLQSGVYIYSLTARDLTGRTTNSTGKMSLLK